MNRKESLSLDAPSFPRIGPASRGWLVMLFNGNWDELKKTDREGLPTGHYRGIKA